MNMLANSEENYVQHVNTSNQTFESFIISDTNARACQDCLSFAKGVGSYPNPLVLCGPSPCGKSHLLQAIKNYIQANDSSVRVRIVPFDDFISLYVEGLHKNDLSKFKSRFFTEDVLMIDNAQLWAGESETQEILSDMFYDMCLSGKRVALASDRPSKYYRPLHKNLNNRLDSFQIIDIDTPDYVIRKKYLMRIIAKNPDILTENMIRYIAASKRISLFGIHGIFRKLCLFERMTGNPLTTKSIIDIIKTYEK